MLSVMCCAKVELVKLTRQQFSSSHILEVYRGSLSQLVCVNDKKDSAFNFLSFNYLIVYSMSKLGQEAKT